LPWASKHHHATTRQRHGYLFEQVFAHDHGLTLTKKKPYVKQEFHDVIKVRYARFLMFVDSVRGGERLKIGQH
jgi:hypothetical protein